MFNFAQNWLDYLIVALYFAVMLGISVYFSLDKKKDAENYLLGGRQMASWVVGLACLMSLFSSISIVMIPGEIMNHGMTLFVLSTFLTPILAIPAYLLFSIFWFRLGSFTAYEYLEYRYDKKIRALVAFSSFYLRVVYIGMVLYASAKIFEGAYHWPTWLSILLTASVGIASCFMGGSKAVVWTDVFQTFVAFGGLLAVVVIGSLKVDGGLLAAVKTAFVDGHGCPQFGQPEFYTLIPYERLLFWLLLWNVFNTVLLDACSNQVIAQRIMSTKNWFEGMKSQLYSNFLGIFFTMLLMLIGLVLYAFYKSHPELDIKPGQGDIALFSFVHQFLPQPLSGLFMAGMLAAIISTVSGVVNSMAGVWLKEFHIKFINRKLDKNGEYMVLRRSTIIIGVFGVVLALGLSYSGEWLQQSVSEVGTLFYLLGAGILPAYLFAVLSRRASSVLIWCTTVFAIGEGVAWNAWYALSRNAVQAYQENPAVGFGWGGKLPLSYVIFCLVVSLILLLPLVSKQLRKKLWTKISGILGCFAAGFTSVVILWFAYSQILVKDAPQEKSFAFTIPIAFIVSFIVLWFCPVQPKEKYQGLTVDSIHDDILVDITAIHNNNSANTTK